MSEPDWASLRSLFPIINQTAYLNHAATSPICQPVRTAIDTYSDQAMTLGSLAYPQWQNRIDEVRCLAARFLGATPGEVAFVGNTSSGLSSIAEGIIWRPGDVILVGWPDFPANIYPWQHLERRGVRVRFVTRRAGQLEADDFRQAWCPKVRLLVVSSVDYVTGYYTDLVALGQLCRERQALFCVDAIQSLGAAPLQVNDCHIDFLAAGGHKWLLGPMGIGLLYVRQDVCAELLPPLVGWKSVEDEENFQLHFELKQDAHKFEPGTMNVAGISGLGAALQLLETIGVARVARRIAGLVKRMEEGLTQRGFQIATPADPARRTGILSFRPPIPAWDCQRQLAAQGVVVAHRQDLLRLSPHFYNDHSDVERFFTALDRLPAA